MRAPAALLLALLTLAGSLGLSVNRHWCGGSLKAIAFFGAEAESCDHDRPAAPACPFHPAPAEEDEDC